MSIFRSPLRHTTPEWSKPASPTLVQRLVRACLYFLSLLLGLSILLLLLRFAVVPILVLCKPSLDIFFFDLGVYGIYPEQRYRSFNLTSPIPRTPKWDQNVCEYERAEGGLVLLDIHGAGVTHKGPTILDLRGNLIWTDNSYAQHAMNLRMQEWKGEQYLTFWAGTDFEGKYIMLDSGFNHARTVQAVGEGLQGDPHEFLITNEDTALIIVYNKTHNVDLASTHMHDLQPYILDGIIQEIDLETGNLLFEWRASDHFNDGEYLKYSYDPTPPHHPKLLDRLFGHVDDQPIDYFHMNSVEKDSDGNYLVSLRRTHQVICISAATGKIMWGFGGPATDFEDLADGTSEPLSDFMWQHDARWVDEKNGVLSLFDNGIAEDHYDGNPYSQGRIIHLNIERKTAKQLHSYASLRHIRSTSQGSFRFLPGSHRDPNLPNAGIAALPKDQVFTGFGSASAYTLHDADSEELLCEVHYAAEMFFFWERTKSYRAIRAPRAMKFRPEAWDPQAVSKNGKVYVSWNGGMEVRSWVLRGRDEDSDWEDVVTVPREGFETVIDLPSDAQYPVYTVTAMGGDGELLRYSNVFEPCAQGFALWKALLIGSAVFVAAGATFAFVRERQRRTPLKLTDVFFKGGKRMQGYRKVESEELGEFQSNTLG